MKKIGIFGGTFDPIHNGHLITCMKLRELRNLDKIIFVPSYISPLKTQNDSAPAEDRYAMVKSAISGINYFSCSDYEIKRSEISYTINTVKKFLDEYENIELIIGYDNLVVFDQWYKPDEILELATVVVLKRKIDNAEIYHNYIDKVTIVDSPIIEISATDIRERVRRGRPIDFLVPESVKNYIFKNNLYQ